MVRKGAGHVVSVLGLLGASLAAQQQVGSVRGVVLDKDFNAPLVGAQVGIVETGQKATTTEQGNFLIPQVPAGRYTLVFAKDGYIRQLRSDVLVAGGQLAEVDVALSGDITQMDEFVAQDVLQLGGGSEIGLMQLRQESPALMNAISGELLARSGAPDAAQAIRLVAGASVQNGKSAVIRGLPDRYVSSQMNGVRLPSTDEDKRAVELDQFPSTIIDSINISKTFTPDQQGDGSGGAVDLRLKGIPDEPFFVRYKGQTGWNSQVKRRGDFLSYEGGGVNYWGRDHSRVQQLDNLGGNWDGAVGVSTTHAPVDYKWSAAIGGKEELDNGIRVGGFANLFYERSSSFYDNGIDDSYWVETPGAGMTPKASQGAVSQGDFKTALFDVTQGKQQVKWGTLGVLGAETENHALTLAYLRTHVADDTATLAQDTRGKAYFFPGYDPHDPNSPGRGEPGAAPYLRLETLAYTERTTDTLQLSGRHKFPIYQESDARKAPELDWTVAHSNARLDQPDKRQFGSLWVPGRVAGPIVIPPTWRGYKPSANFTQGNLQRIWKTIDESSTELSVDAKLPCEQWTDQLGYLKVGVFQDRLERKFNQDSFSNFGDNSSFEGGFDEYWSSHFPDEDHAIGASTYDVDYKGNQRIAATYAMLDLPLFSMVKAVGGVRFESTHIGVVNAPEADATWFPPGSSAPTTLNPGDADVSFGQHDALPALSLEFTPIEEISFRASWSKTVARQTFKEITPIIQQEYLGAPIFIGNPELRMSELHNYDLRVDYTPYQGGLVSAAWFEKDIDDPIEYVQRLYTFDFTTAVNYPKGHLSGWEFEVRQDLGHLFEPLEGFSIGANATFIDSKVTLPEDEALGFESPAIQAPMRSREMTNAPDHLYNLFLTYDSEHTGTKFGIFYTIQGDTLIAGAAESNGNYVPNVYAKEYDTLNLSVAQRIATGIELQLGAKNLTNPEISSVYRSPYIGDDVRKTSYTRGVEYTIGIGGEIRF